MIRDIKSIPVFRPFLGLVTGIAAERFITFSWQFLILVMIVLFLILMLAQLFRIALKPIYSWLPGIFINLIFVFTGALSINCYHSGNKLISDTTKEIWVGEVLNDPVIKNRTARFEMSLFIDSEGITRSKTQVLIQIGSSFVVPEAGQILVLKTKPERVQGPMNPGEFNYASYLESNGILYRSFVKEGEWRIVTSNDEFNLQYLAGKVKKKLWEKIENQEAGNENLGVLYALSLGSKDLLTPEIKETYSSTGAMHVLVVSGQHIALIWMVLSYIFLWINQIRGGKYIQFFLITGLIWFYSFMTGITASVVRASGMFTMVSLGKIIQKESSIYNSLCVSAFLGLLIWPQWLTDPGFQLSYIAVLSIVFFQPKVSALWTPKYWIIQKVWEIASVSIAAQIGTLPLTLFYFNRFPPWFILSNIVVIPLVTLLMILFIIMLFFMMIPLIFAVLLKLILFLIGIMNSSLYYIERLPSPEMDIIYLNNFQMFCFVITLLTSIFFIRYRKNSFLLVGLTALLFLVSAGTYRQYKTSQRSEMVLFSTPGRMIVGFFTGERGLFIHNAPDTTDISGTLNFKCKPYLVRNRIKESDLVSLSDTLKLLYSFRNLPGKYNYYLRFKEKSLIILNDPVYYSGMNSKIVLKSDLLVVNDRIPKVWKGHNSIFLAKQLIISSAPSKYKQFTKYDSWIIKMDSIYDTRSLGAFILTDIN
jgi:competence protein ComEC